MTKHIVRLCRTRFELVVLDVEAPDDEAAIRRPRRLHPLLERLRPKPKT